MSRATFASALLASMLVVACNGGSGFSGTSGKKERPAESTENEKEELGGSSNATGIVATQTNTSTETQLGGSDPLFDQRLQEQNAQTGEIQVSLLWNNQNDLDLHMVGPTGEHIYFGATTDTIGGFLDVDMNAGSTVSSTPVENVFWTAGQAQHGLYKIYVHHYANRGTENPSAFKIRLKVGGAITFHEGSAMWTGTDSGFGLQDTWPAGDSSGSLADAVPSDAVLVHQFNY